MKREFLQTVKQNLAARSAVGSQPHFFWGIVSAILGGLATFFATQPHNHWFLAFFGVGIFGAFSLYFRPLKAGFFGFLWAFTYFFTLFDWVTIASGTPVARIALTTVLSINFVLIAWSWSWLFTPYRQGYSPPRQNPSTFLHIFCSIIFAAFIWIAFEQLRMVFPLGGMPWGNLAFILTESPLLLLARYGGTQLVQFVALLVGLCGTFAFFSCKKQKFFHSTLFSFSTVLLIVLPFLVPNIKLDGTQINALVVQGNTPMPLSDYSPAVRALKVTENHVQLTGENFQDAVQLVIWPESASDRDFRKDAAVKAAFTPIQQFLGQTPLLIGTQAYFADGTRTNDYLVYQSGQVVGQYSKQHPVPFGEYVPWRKTIGKFFTEIEQITTDMIPGSPPARLNVPLKEPILDNTSGEVRTHLVVGTPICFEVAFDEIVTQAAQGSDFLIFPTNNSSFHYSAQAAQQFAIAKFRAVEHGKMVVQAAMSGVSGVIDPNGVELYQTQLFASDARIVPIELRNTVSFAGKTYQQRLFLSYLLGSSATCIALVRYVKLRRTSTARD